ncbi:MAG: ComEA family DNA-binding protein [Candidatus Saganbacteria bacterium]|nr:ComEA family DNA-binding protein [Candidatus Saganbacteria bacterium]
MPFDLNRQQQLILAGLVVLIIVGLGIMVLRHSFSPAPAVVITRVEQPELQQSAAANKIVVHLSGAVKRQGVFSLKEGDRLVDLLKAAGGLSQQADLSKVNLAEKLVDGQKIQVPVSPVQVPGTKQVISAAEDGAGIELNAADLNQLCQIKGIGKTTAKRIIEYREQNGPFQKLDDLVKVKGVGKGTLDRIRGQLRI